MSKMINKNKIVFISTLSFASIFLVGSVFASYLVQDNADPIGIQIQVAPPVGENYYLVGSFSNNVVNEQYKLTKQSDGTYTYGSASNALLCQTSEQVRVYNNSNVSVSTYTIPVEGTYSFTFNKTASSLTTQRYTKAVYLYLINKVRLWDNSYWVYAWNSSSSMNWNTEGQMTYDSSTGCYKYLIKEEYSSIIFHNGHTNTSDSRVQTGNLGYNVVKPLYQMSSNSKGDWTAFNAAKNSLDTNETFNHYLTGPFTNWGTNPTYGFEKSGDNSQYIYTLNLSAGTEFKVCGNTGWLGFDNIKSDNKSTYFEPIGNDKNIGVKANQSGKYTFYVKGTNIYFSKF